MEAALAYKFHKSEMSILPESNENGGEGSNNANVQNTLLWQQIEDSLEKYKRDSQINYKQMLDE